jgi:hypothetical protein
VKFNPLKREETPLHAVANEPKRKAANGRVVKGRILKHEPYAKAKLSAAPMTGYKLPVEGFR